MAQITATIEDSMVQDIDRAASERGISRSRWIALAIHAYLTKGEQPAAPLLPPTLGTSNNPVPAGQHPVQEHTVSAHDDTLLRDHDHMKEEVQRLMHELEGKNQVIRLQSDEIGWLRGECAKLTDRVLLALPSPKKHWWAFWRQG